MIEEDPFVIKPVAVPKIDDDLSDRIHRRYQCTAMVGIRQSGKTQCLVHLIRTFYAKSYDLIFILSPSCLLDKTWKHVEKYKNVFMYDKCTNDILFNILKIQKERALVGKELLLIIDDFGVNRNLGTMIDEIAARGRHSRLQLITTVQYFRNLTPVCRNNLDNLLLWRISTKEQKKVAEDIPQVTEEEFIQMAQHATDEPFKFLYVNFKKPKYQGMFNIGF